MFCTGRIVERAETSGFCGAVSNGPSGRVAAGDADAVTALGAALGDHQVPRAVDLVEVRRLGELAAGARPQRARLLERDVVVEIDLHLQDAEVRADLGAARGSDPE